MQDHVSRLVGLDGFRVKCVIEVELVSYTQMLWMGLRTKAAYLPG
jgi:hypothetical protein